MASYSLKGYATPSGVDSREKVKDYQRMLGVTADGIWGPVTQAAYERYNAGIYGMSSPFGAAGDAFPKYYEAIRGMIAAPGVSVSVPSREEIARDYAEALRPGVDLAIQTRRRRGEEAMAEIDADAASRGMAASTYVSSMKEREGDDVEGDVSMMEAQYTATLAERIAAALEHYSSLEFEAARTNAQMAQSAGSAAAGIAMQWYQSYLNGMGGASVSPSGTWEEPRLAPEDYLEYVALLGAAGRRELFYSPSEEWAKRREELIEALGRERYEALKRQYAYATGSGATSAGGRLWQNSTK